jgi:hypothetical protein
MHPVRPAPYGCESSRYESVSKTVAGDCLSLNLNGVENYFFSDMTSCSMEIFTDVPE